MEYTQILLKPVISEKGTFLKEQSNQVAFYVHKDANKVEIKKAVEAAFGVTVESVNVLKKKPLHKQVSRGRKRQASRIAGYKKAYVTLAADNKIEFFEGV